MPMEDGIVYHCPGWESHCELPSGVEKRGMELKSSFEVFLGETSDSVETALLSDLAPVF